MQFRYTLSVLFISIRHSLLRSVDRSNRFHFSSMSSTLPSIRKSGEELVKCFPEKYDDLFSEKVDRLRDLLKESINPGIDIEKFESPKTNFRMRANFNIWRDNGKDIKSNNWYYAMFDEGNKSVPCEITSFPRGTHKMNQLMNELRENINSVPELYESLFEARFVTTQIDEASIVLIYKRPLPATWKQHAEVLAARLNAKIIGRSRKVKEVAGGEEYIKETLSVGGKPFHYFHIEGAFSQPNAKVCEKMLEWAVAKTANSQDQDLVELYCGGGTFTIAMAQNFNRVLATEMSRQSVELANLAIAANEVTNIKIARCSAEEFSEAHKSKRNLHRFTEAGIDIAKYNTRTVFVDPPRAGVDVDTCKLLAQFDRIVYVSCNPETLARDLRALTTSHDVIHVAAFDQFPYTHHLESGVVLVKRVVPCPTTASELSTEPIATVESLESERHESVLGKRKCDSSEEQPR